MSEPEGVVLPASGEQTHFPFGFLGNAIEGIVHTAVEGVLELAEVKPSELEVASFKIPSLIESNIVYYAFSAVKSYARSINLGFLIASIYGKAYCLLSDDCEKFIQTLALGHCDFEKSIGEATVQEI